MPKGTKSPKMHAEAPASAPGTPHRAGGTREPVCVPVLQQGTAAPGRQQHGGDGCPQSSPGHHCGLAVAATGFPHTQWGRTRARRNK